MMELGDLVIVSLIMTKWLFDTTQISTPYQHMKAVIQVAALTLLIQLGALGISGLTSNFVSHDDFKGESLTEIAPAVTRDKIHRHAWYT